MKLNICFVVEDRHQKSVLKVMEQCVTVLGSVGAGRLEEFTRRVKKIALDAGRLKRLSRGTGHRKVKKKMTFGKRLNFTRGNNSSDKVVLVYTSRSIQYSPPIK